MAAIFNQFAFYTGVSIISYEIFLMISFTATTAEARGLDSRDRCQLTVTGFYTA
jgi:hypothetical protein